MYIKKQIREQVYNKCDKRCAYCGNELVSIKDMQIDHILPRTYENIVKSLARVSKDAYKHYKHYEDIYGIIPKSIDDIENLNPSCRACNHYKRALTLNEFRYRMISLHERIQADYINKVAEKFGIITVKPFDGRFYFEK